MAKAHGRYANLFPVNGLDLSAANRYDDGQKYDEPKVLSHLGFFIYRISLSKYRDMDSPYHTQLVAENGIKAFGWYAAPKIGRTNWKAQVDKNVEIAEFFRKEYGTPLVPPMGIYIDVERRSLDKSVSHTKLSVTNWLIKYTNRMSDAFGEENLGIYTGLVWNELTYKTDRFKNLRLFHAQYNDWITQPSRLARDWEDHGNLLKKWKLWQWAAEGYKVNGTYPKEHVGVHSYFVDFDRWNGSIASFWGEFGVSPFVYQGTPPPFPPPPAPPLPEDKGYPIGQINTKGYTLWSHSEPNALVSTRDGYIGDGTQLVIEDTDNSGDWYKIHDSNSWVSAKFLDLTTDMVCAGGQ